MNKSRLRLSFGFAYVTLTLIGCGGSDGPKLVPVSGTVTVGGSEPFQKGFVRFMPQEGKKQLGGSATTDGKGNFVLKHTSNRAGIEPGDYNVYFSLMKLPDGSPLPDQSGEHHRKSPMELGGVESVPPELSSMTSTANPANVSSSGGTFKFDIPALRPPKGAKK
jgi:hypothetical protein